MFLFIRLRNHRLWEKCVSIHLCDSKYVRVLIQPKHLYGIYIYHEHFLTSWRNQTTPPLYLDYFLTEICLRLMRGNGAKSHTVCEHS